MSDIFREVEEDLRREELRKIWDKYGIYVVGLALGIVLVTAAVVGWRAYSLSEAEEASLAYEAALAEAEETPEAAAEKLAALAEESPAGYAALAQLRRAAALAEEGDRQGAISVYEQLASNSAAGEIIQELAQIKAASLLIGNASHDDIRLRLVGLTGEGKPWRNLARELLGLSAYKAGEYAEARSLFQEITRDNTATPGLRDRAHVMIALISPKIAAEALESSPPADEPVADEAPAEEASGEAAPAEEAAPEPAAGESE